MQKQALSCTLRKWRGEAIYCGRSSGVPKQAVAATNNCASAIHREEEGAHTGAYGNRLYKVRCRESERMHRKLRGTDLAHTMTTIYPLYKTPRLSSQRQKQYRLNTAFQCYLDDYHLQ